MKQVLQDLVKGATTLTEAPSPRASKGSLLISTSTTLVSAGTERMLVDFGRASCSPRPASSPTRSAGARQGAHRRAADHDRGGTQQARLSRSARLLQRRRGGRGRAGCRGLRAGRPGGFQRQPCRGGRRCPRISARASPTRVSDEAAAFTVLAAIGLQGIRLAEPTLGEAFVVTGLGLIGLLTVQLLRAHGCRVLGIDPDPAGWRWRAQFGAETVQPAAGEDPVAAAQAFSRGRGVDGVIITASTSSTEPVYQAAQMCRKRGRIVLVGVTGLELNRADFYEKELSFQVSCSYGPGRYDPAYEAGRHDYPLGFVRWTEQRNFEAVLDLHGSGRARRRAAGHPPLRHRPAPRGLRPDDRGPQRRWASCSTTRPGREHRRRRVAGAD